MMNYNNEAVIWFVAGVALFLLEFVMPGLILFFFAVGAWVVAILTLFLDISINTELIIFVVTSVLTILLFRKSLHKIMWSKKSSNEIEDELIGKVVKATTGISPGENGKVELNGTLWDAKSDDTIEKGENVKIIGNESILLIVKSTKI